MNHEMKCKERGCGKTFRITEEQHEYLKGKFGTVPQRCPECRIKKNQRVKQLEEERREREERIALKVNSPFFHLLPPERQLAIRKGDV